MANILQKISYEHNESFQRRTFHPRCFTAEDRCGKEEDPFYEVGKGRKRQGGRARSPKADIS
jgi:hypothetical protein